jgi:hypothetical protein
MYIAVSWSTQNYFRDPSLKDRVDKWNVSNPITQINDTYDKLDEYEDKVDKVNEELNEAKQRIRSLENDLQKKNRALDLQRREQSSMVIRLEREKRALVEQLAIVEQRMDIEKVRAKMSTQTKEVVLGLNDGMKKQYVYFLGMLILETHRLSLLMPQPHGFLLIPNSYSFYRDYYDQQDALYKSYFGKNDEGAGIKAAEERKHPWLPTICEERSLGGSPNSREGAISRFSIDREGRECITARPRF